MLHTLTTPSLEHPRYISTLLCDTTLKRGGAPNQYLGHSHHCSQDRGILHLQAGATPDQSCPIPEASPGQIQFDGSAGASQGLQQQRPSLLWAEWPLPQFRFSLHLNSGPVLGIHPPPARGQALKLKSLLPGNCRWEVRMTHIWP